MIANTKLNDANLIKAVDMKIILAATYAMNICRFNVDEVKELDQTIKREHRGKNMLGKQASNKRLYLKREEGGRGLNLLRDSFKETKLCVACYTLPSRPINRLKLHGEETRSRRSMQSLRND